MNTLNRRKFLSSSALLATSSLITVTANAAAKNPMPAKWDEEADIIVVGSGFAGLAAAAEAKNANAGNVIVLEKMRAPGGNSVINGGIFAVPGNPAQVKLGIKDSPELLASDMIAAGLGYGYPEKIKAMTEEALPTYEWTVKELGVQYNDKVGQEGGHSVPRHVYNINGSRSEIVHKQLAYAKKLGIPVRLRVYVERIIRDEDGRVKGLQVREGYRFPNAQSGKVKFIKAKKAVILCHGGFGADVNYRMKHDPKLTDKFDTTNQPGATSELWREASRIGGNLIQADWIQCGPWNSPEEKGMGVALYFAQGAAATQGIWIDCATGKRFVNELANRKIRADAVITNNNKGHTCIALADQTAVDLTIQKSRPGILDKQLERKVVHKFATLEDLAKQYNVLMDALQATIADYNKHQAEGTPDEMGRKIYKGAQAIGTGPWYCSILSPKVHHCMGGLETNSKGQVIDVSSDKPIPGLYAAGESTGGVHGAVRLGSCAVLDCLANGRIAGRKAAQEQNWS